jgi:hypothetical protein
MQIRKCGVMNWRRKNGGNLGDRIGIENLIEGLYKKIKETEGQK